MVINNREELESVKASGKPVIVEYATPSCASCRMMRMVIASVGKTFGDSITTCEVDVKDHPDLAPKAAADTVPVVQVWTPEGELESEYYGVVSQRVLREDLERILEC